jgi:hypothetical protein
MINLINNQKKLQAQNKNNNNLRYNHEIKMVIFIRLNTFQVTTLMRS